MAQAGGGGGSGGPTGPGDVIPPVLTSSFIETVGWSELMGDMSSYFDGLNETVTRVDQQSSFYDHGYDTAPWAFEFGANFGWSETQRQALGFYYYDYLTADIDPEFLVSAYTSTGFSMTAGGNTGSVTPINADSFYINMNGLRWLATWEMGTAGPPDPNEITVNGRHLVFQLAGIENNSSQNTNPPAPPVLCQPVWTGPDLTKVNPIGILTAPDGATYYLPESVTEQYLIDALNHLSEYRKTHDNYEVLLEFKAMYSDKTHPHYIDFKDWGTANGPTGSVGADPITYFSPAAGKDIIGTSPFEAFGNWFYGFAGAWAGLSADILYASAALFQEGNNSLIPFDAPEDRPHVSAGISAAQGQYVNGQSTVFSINTWSGY